MKNYGIWVRYQSRTGYHNAYKEYRDTTLNGAVEQLYQVRYCRGYCTAGYYGGTAAGNMVSWYCGGYCGGVAVIWYCSAGQRGREGGWGHPWEKALTGAGREGGMEGGLWRRGEGEARQDSVHPSRGLRQHGPMASAAAKQPLEGGAMRAALSWRRGRVWSRSASSRFKQWARAGLQRPAAAARAPARVQQDGSGGPSSAAPCRALSSSPLLLASFRCRKEMGSRHRAPCSSSRPALTALPPTLCCARCAALPQEMGSRHRVRHQSIQIIKYATLVASQCKRANIVQFHDSSIKFPLTRKVVR